MIEDARVLQPEFIPNEVVHRDAEVQHLSHVLEPITESEPAEPSLLFGPSGVGKTCITQFTVERLREAVVNLNTQYVNCWEDHTRFQSLYRILEGINQTYDVHRQSTPRDLLLERLRDYDDAPYIVILDEVDQLADKSLLYDLFRIQGLTMVMIANREEDVFATLDDRLHSRLRTCARIQFDAYHDDELVAILQDRVRWGLTEDAIDTDHLEYIADAAAGDARVAIGILRTAARTAEQHRTETITRSILEESVSEAKMEIKQKSLDRLTDHQKTLYDIIRERNEITPPELYEEYNERVDDPKSNRTVRNYLEKLEQYKLILANGNTKSRTYHLYS